MISPSSDPLADVGRREDEEAAFEALCPVCDICGEPITDDYYYTVGGITFHEDCAEKHSVEDFVEGRRYE